MFPFGPRSCRRFVALLLGLLVVGAVGCAPIASSVSGAGQGSAQASVPNPASLGLVQPQPAVRQANDTPPGRILYVRDGNLWLWQAGASHQFSEGGTWSQPSFSPGGKEIAYVYWAQNFSDVFVMASDGSKSAAAHPRPVQQPAWTIAGRSGRPGRRTASASPTSATRPRDSRSSG